MLEFPKNALACQLTDRLKNIVNWVSNKCNDEWTEYYAVELMDKLVAYSQPKDGSECLPEDHATIGATCKSYLSLSNINTIIDIEKSLVKITTELVIINWIDLHYSWHWYS